MDIITTAAIAYVTKDGIEKLLGPTFEYYGIGLKNTIENFNNKAKKNLDNIIQKSIIKKGKKLEEKGLINPRILKEVVMDGSFCDTNVVQEYYSGILACSRTEAGTDEGIYYINILKGLSSRQLKAHYFIYSKFIKQNKGINCNLHVERELRRFKVNFSTKEIIDNLKLVTKKESDSFLCNDIPAIYQAGLIGSYSFDTTNKEVEKQFEFSITLLGVSLFLQALGFSEVFAPRCLNDENIEEIVDNIIPINEL